MHQELKAHVTAVLDFSSAELDLIDRYFHEVRLKKKELLLEGGQVCNTLTFVAEGCIRQFHLKDGDERTCDLSFAGAWVTDMKSFNQGTPCVMHHQALEETRVSSITKADLLALYAACPKFGTYGRMMTEQVLERASAIAMSLGSDSPEERYLKLFSCRSDLFQRVPQKYIANMLGISAESLSRLRARLVGKKRT